MTEWLTTGQMIDKLKVGEIAEVVSEGVNQGYKLHINQLGNFVAIGDNSTCAVLNKGCINAKWRITPKYVSFEEARKAYQQGKTIRCDYNSVIDDSKCFNKFALNKPQYEGDLSFYMINEGKWTIEE